MINKKSYYRIVHKTKKGKKDILEEDYISEEEAKTLCLEYALALGDKSVTYVKVRD